MLSNLNESQKKAVLAVNGPVMVFAGAGSGKTRTLTYRVAYMIGEEKISPYNILAITFTNKATNEMRERLYNLIGSAADETTISTFHSLCARILRREIHHLGYSRNFTIIDDEDQLKILNDLLKEENIDKKKTSGRYIQKIINNCKCFNLKPEIPLDNILMNKYEAKMKELNLLDFEDLLLKTYELFTLHEEVLNKYANRYKYVLVDEFQDTNLIQYKIIKLLAKDSHNLFVVGDDDQSIYSFRGTNYENMNLFKKDFPDHKIFYLTQNYRSTQTILDGCNRLIANNKNREKKELFSEIKGTHSDVVISQPPTEKYEVEYIVDEIMSLKLKGMEYNDFAILYRSNVLLRNIELGLIQAGLPYQVYGGISYLRRREIKDIISYFKLILNHDDIYSFQRIVNVPSRMIGETTVNKIIELKNKYKISLFEALDSCKTILSTRRYSALMDFKNLIIELKEDLETNTFIEVYEKLLEKIEYHNYLLKEDDGVDRIENIEEFKSILLQLEESSLDTSRAERLELAFDQALLNDDIRQSKKENVNGIIVSTIHSVKGLEFKNVFVIGLEENVFPNSYRFTDESEIEEERRIAYVAFTRAKEKLYLLSTQNRLLYGERFNNRPSRFLIEFAGALFEDKKTNESRQIEKKSTQLLSDDELPDYRPGDKVVHDKFGSGIIISINNTIGQIFFDDSKSIKTIMLNHPSLSKIN